MSEKKFTPYEVAMAILKKSQEVYNKHAELQKAEVCKEEVVEKCGESKVVGKGEEIEKFMAPDSSVKGSVASTGGPSIASQIGFGKGEDKQDKKKDKKLPDFLKKKFMKKSDGAPKAPTAAAGSPSNSPQSPKVAAGGLPPVKEEK
jgi:hypothetical protein